MNASHAFRFTDQYYNIRVLVSDVYISANGRIYHKYYTVATDRDGHILMKSKFEAGQEFIYFLEFLNLVSALFEGIEKKLKFGAL